MAIKSTKEKAYWVSVCFCGFSLYILNLTDRQLLFIENKTVTWRGELRKGWGGGGGRAALRFPRNEVNEPKKIRMRTGRQNPLVSTSYLATKHLFSTKKLLALLNNWKFIVLTIYAPRIYTAPCIMFWMRAYPLRGQVGGGWALEIESFLGPVKCHWAYRRVPFGAPKTLCTGLYKS